MLTGLLIAVPLLLTAYAAQTDWTPHKTVLIAVVTMASVKPCYADSSSRTPPQKSKPERRGMGPYSQ
jgi:hypothetical protein